MKRGTNAENRRKFAERKPLYDALRNMPPLAHWPDRSKPFEPGESQVLRHIISLFADHLPRLAHASENEQFNEAQKILVCANNGSPTHSMALFFDHDSGLWEGINRSVPQAVTTSGSPNQPVN